MEQPTPSEEFELEENEQSADNSRINRRQLIKMLAAGGAVTAASMVPGKWSSPAVKTGVLPAHAQVTQTFNLTCPADSQISINAGNDAVVMTTVMVSPTPPTGTVLNAAYTTSFGASASGQASTDANGEASFSETFTAGQFVDGSTVTVAITFDNQNSFGSGRCATTYTIRVREPA